MAETSPSSTWFSLNGGRIRRVRALDDIAKLTTLFRASNSSVHNTLNIKERAMNVLVQEQELILLGKVGSENGLTTG